MKLITLTTDFGTRDWYVACMKGVILSLEPRQPIVDVTHEIPAGDIRAGAFVLAAAYQCFPRGSIHVAVVDPGVGSPRAALAVGTENYWFLGPDNGVLSLALTQERIKTICRIENERGLRGPVSATFHGRDIFAPPAARLSRGLGGQKLGPAQRDYVRLEWPEPGEEGDKIRGAIIYFDQFGNGISNIGAGRLDRLKSPDLVISVPGRLQAPLRRYYQAAAPGEPVAVIGSSNFLEIAVNGGSARQLLGLEAGDPVLVSPKNH